MLLDNLLVSLEFLLEIPTFVLNGSLGFLSLCFLFALLLIRIIIFAKITTQEIPENTNIMAKCGVVEGQGKKDALYLPEVLEVILKNLDNSSLLQCRLVCKKWNAEAKKILENQIAAQPNHPSHYFHFARYCSGYIEDLSIKFKKFQFDVQIGHPSRLGFISTKGLENCLASLKYHVRSLKINLRIESAVSMSAKQLLQAIFLLVPNLESLTVMIDLRIPKRRRKIGRVIASLADERALYPSGALPHLESIRIESAIGPFPMDYARQIGLFTCQLLSSATNLKSLNVQMWGFDGTSSTFFPDIISSITSIHFKNLKMSDRWVSSENLSALAKPAIPFSLATVELTQIDLRHVNLVDMNKFLTTYSSSLETLTLNYWYTKEHCDDPYIHFPPLGVRMIKLRSLSIHIGKPVVFNWSHVPQLKRLALGFSAFEGLQPCTTIDSSHFPLESLRLNFDQSSLRNEEMLKIFIEVKVFLLSRLTYLRLTFAVSAQLVQLVFKECRQLKQLFVVGSRYNEINDQTLCGVADSEINQLSVVWPDADVENEEGETEETMDKQFRCLITKAKSSDDGPRRTLAYIGDLKDLQILRLDLNKCSELSLIHGVVHCSALRELYIALNIPTKLQRATRIIRQAGLKYLVRSRIGKYVDE